MASRAPKCPYLPVTLDWTDQKHCQVKNYDVLAGDNTVGNIRGCVWTDNYGERRYLTGTAAEFFDVTGLKCGVDGGSITAYRRQLQ